MSTDSIVSPRRVSHLQRELSANSDPAVDIISGAKRDPSIVRKKSEAKVAPSVFTEARAEGNYNILSNEPVHAKTIKASPSAGSLRKEVEANSRGMGPFGQPSTNPLSPRGPQDKIKLDPSVAYGVVKPSSTGYHPLTGNPVPVERQNSATKVSAGKIKHEQAKTHDNVDPILGAPKAHEFPPKTKVTAGAFRREQEQLGKGVDPIHGQPKGNVYDP